MKSIPQNGRPFNAPTLPFVGITAPAVPFQVDSQTTLMGHRSHTVTTHEMGFAYALYEQALHIDIEPDFEQFQGVWSIGFICDDSERDTALSLAQEVLS